MHVPIYQGDNEVNVGEPFSITCIVSITEPIVWLKDKDVIKKHTSFRHAKDDYLIQEIEGTSYICNKNVIFIIFLNIEFLFKITLICK